MALQSIYQYQWYGIKMKPWEEKKIALQKHHLHVSSSKKWKYKWLDLAYLFSP